MSTRKWGFQTTFISAANVDAYKRTSNNILYDVWPRGWGETEILIGTCLRARRRNHDFFKALDCEEITLSLWAFEN